MTLKEKLSRWATGVIKLFRRPLSARKFAISFLAVFGGFFLFWTSLVWLIDPYMYYHRGWILKNVYSNSSARIPGVMRNFDFDAVLFGSSMCQNFKCSEINDALNVKCVKATTAGVTSAALSRYFEIARRYRRDKLTRCVYGIDIWSFTKKSDDNYNYRYLYEDRIFPCEYFYSNDTVNAITDVVITNIAAGFNHIAKHQLDEDVMFSNKPRHKYNRKSLEKDVRGLTDGPNTPDAETVRRFDEHLFIHVRNHPEIKFDLFLPPYHIYFWCFLREKGKLEDYLAMRNSFAQMAAKYPNVRLHDFQADFDIVCSFDIYKDVSHYSPKINTVIINDIGSGKNVFSLDEFIRRTDLIRSRSATFQAEFNKLRTKCL